MTKQTLKDYGTEVKQTGLNFTVDNMYWFNVIVKDIERLQGKALSNSEKGFLLMDVLNKGLI